MEAEGGAEPGLSNVVQRIIWLRGVCINWLLVCLYVPRRVRREIHPQVNGRVPFYGQNMQV
jgi:hypothetical protein